MRYQCRRKRLWFSLMLLRQHLLKIVLYNIIYYIIKAYQALTRKVLVCCSKRAKHCPPKVNQVKFWKLKSNFKLLFSKYIYCSKFCTICLRVHMSYIIMGASINHVSLKRGAGVEKKHKISLRRGGREKYHIYLFSISIKN